MRTLIALVLTAWGCATAAPLSPADIYARVAASAVVVRSEIGTGSGTVILNDQGRALVLGAHHVIGADRKHVRVVIADTEIAPDGELRARVVAVDIEHDLMLLEVADLDRPAMPLAACEPSLYEQLFSVAAPMGLAGTASPALLTSKAVRRGEMDLWEITGFVFFGTSGGTVANDRAELVGVPVIVAMWGNLPIPHLGLLVPLPTIRQFLARSPYATAFQE